MVRRMEEIVTDRRDFLSPSINFGVEKSDMVISTAKTLTPPPTPKRQKKFLW